MQSPKGDSVFFPLRFKPKNSKEELELPKFTLRKDETVRYALFSALEEKDLNLRNGLLDVASAMSGTFIRLGSLIFEKPVSWVEETLTLVDIAELLALLVFEPVKSEAKTNEKWGLSDILDFCAKEYGFTIEETLFMTRWELNEFLGAAARRLDKQVKAAEGKGGHGGRRISPRKVQHGPDAAKSFGQKFGMLKKT